MLIGRDVTRPRKQRLATRAVWSGTCSPRNDNGVDLCVSRGAWVQRIDKLGDEVDRVRDSGKQLYANIGDALMVSAADLAVDEVALVEIFAVQPDGIAYAASVRCGTAPSGRCHVMAAGKAGKR